MTATEMIAALQSQHGISEAYARKIVAANTSAPVTAPTPSTPRPISEAEEQRRIRRTAIDLGAKVYWLSQARKTGQTPGLPDLWLAFPAFGMWWETKATDGRLSPWQEQFRGECQRHTVGIGHA
jgi:hypothetical protein